LMLPFTLAWRAWRNRRWVEAGVWLGACASVKLFLLLFLPWLAWRRRWGAIAAAAATMSALVLLGIGVFGVGAYREWVRTLGRVGWAWLTMNASWQGFVSRLLHGAPKVAPLVSRPELVAPIAVVGCAAIAAITLLVAARRERSPDATVLLLLLGAILASPLGWIYYLPLAYGPILGWMGAGRKWDRLRQLEQPTLVLLAIGVALCYVPQETTRIGQPSALASITIGSAYFWGVLAGWLGVLQARQA
jgi:Glycosyltransferase family 87